MAAYVPGEIGTIQTEFRHSRLAFAQYAEPVYLSLGAGDGMVKVWQETMVAFFLSKDLIDQEWTYSVDGSILVSAPKGFFKGWSQSCGLLIAHATQCC